MTVRGVIDLGSNSVRLKVVRSDRGGGWVTLAEEREMVRLGRSIASEGAIDRDAYQDALRAVRGFKQVLTSLRVEAPRVFATAAIRDAVNGPSVARQIERILETPVRVLSTREEGEFLLRGARREFPMLRKTGVVADLGGGSMQAVRTCKGFTVENVSMPIGALRLAERFGSGRISKRCYASMRTFVQSHLKKHVLVRDSNCEFLAGAGGGFAASESMARAAGIRGKIPRAEVRRQILRLADVDPESRLRMPGLEAKRIDIIVPALCVMYEFMKHIRADSFVNYGDGIRDGMLIESFEGPQDESVNLLDSAEKLAKRAAGGFEHACQVRVNAFKISESLRRLDPDRFGFLVIQRELLESAAFIHDVGTEIHEEHHHEWGFRIALSETLQHVSEEQRTALALLVRHHRQDDMTLKCARRAGVSADFARQLVILSSILRAADALDRSHRSKIKQIELGRDDRRSGWIRVHGRGDLTAELAALRKKGRAMLSLIAPEVRVEAV